MPRKPMVCEFKKWGGEDNLEHIKLKYKNKKSFHRLTLEFK